MVKKADANDGVWRNLDAGDHACFVLTSAAWAYVINSRKLESGLENDGLCGLDARSRQLKIRVDRFG